MFFHLVDQSAMPITPAMIFFFARSLSSCFLALPDCIFNINSLLCSFSIDLNISLSSALPSSSSCIASSFPFNFGMLSLFWKVSVAFVWPSPNCPQLFFPQLHTPPSQSTICQKNCAVLQEEREDIGGRLLTFCGVCLSFLSPNPSCPCIFPPQVKIFPCLSRNIEK